MPSAQFGMALLLATVKLVRSSGCVHAQQELRLLDVFIGEGVRDRLLEVLLQGSVDLQVLGCRGVRHGSSEYVCRTGGST